jgi:uncharacterized membrane protein
MGQFAVQVNEVESQKAPSLRLIAGGKAAALTASIPTEIVVLGLVLAILQVLDGVLTAIGIHQYGTDMEGNLLLRSLMSLVGYIPALMVVKSASIALIVLLCRQATKMTWLKPAFYGVIALYTFGAVLPWTYILVSDLLA